MYKLIRWKLSNLSRATTMRAFAEASSALRPPPMQWDVLLYFAILNIAVGLGSPLGIAVDSALAIF